MKGVKLVSNMFLLMMLILSFLIVSGLVFVTRAIYGIEGLVGLGPEASGTREVTMRVFFKPVADESTLLALMEMDHEGIPMKEILNAAAIQDSTDVWIDGNSIDVTQAVKYILEDPSIGMLKGRRYLLKISNPELIIASQPPLPARSQKTSTKLFLLGGRSADLVLYTD